MKKKFFLFLLIFIAIFLVFRGLSETFYQQDEWHTLGSLRTEGLSYILTGSSFIDVLFLENRPLSRIANIILFGQFPLNITPIFIFAMFFHSLNTFLVYKLAKYLGVNKLIAVVTAIFFLINSSGKQAIMWFGTVSGTLPSATGILLAIYFYLRYLDSRHRLHAILTVLFLIISLGFKETGLFLFLLLPLAELTKNIIEKKKFKITLPSIFFILIAFIVFISKFASVYFTSGTATRYVNADSGGGIIRLIWNAFTFPIEAFSQILIPSEVIFPLSRRITGSVFSYFETSGYAGLISEIIVVELISILFSFGLIIPLVILWSKKKKKWPVVFVILFYLLSFIPYLVLIKPNGYLESRYYYLATIPVAFIVGLSLQDILGKIKSIAKQRNVLVFVNVAIFIMIGFYFVMHARFIDDQLNFLKERAIVQKSVLAEILSKHPKLSQNQVFYIESDHSFIVPNNPLPFQNGIGYTLLVTYAYKNNTNSLNPFLLDNYFWKLGNQGYFEKNGQGFGFFTDLELLKKEIKDNNFKKESVVAFHYDSVTNKISNITGKIQKDLK